MTEIIDGVYTPNELSINSNGGTEQMAKRMVRDIDPELLKGYQIIHSRVRKLEPNLKKILVCHDLPGDPEVQKLADSEYRNQFEKIVFVSNWQMQMYNTYLGVPYSQSSVIRNGIEDFNIGEKNFNGPLHLIYHTTPHRGLEILYPVYERLAQEFDVYLDVFSSFKAYGWEERDKPYEKLFEKLENHPKIINHGFQSNEMVRDYLKGSHIFAYPNIWQETSCIAAIEALCSGTTMVHPNLGALPETTAFQTMMYQYDENPNAHAQVFYENMKVIIKRIHAAPYDAERMAVMNSAYFNNIYSWKNVVLPRWNGLLTSLK